MNHSFAVGTLVVFFFTSSSFGDIVPLNQCPNRNPKYPTCPEQSETCTASYGPVVVDNQGTKTKLNTCSKSQSNCTNCPSGGTSLSWKPTCSYSYQQQWTITVNGSIQGSVASVVTTTLQGSVGYQSQSTISTTDAYEFTIPACKKMSIAVDYYGTVGKRTHQDVTYIYEETIPVNPNDNRCPAAGANPGDAVLQRTITNSYRSSAVGNYGLNSEGGSPVTTDCQ